MGSADGSSACSSADKRRGGFAKGNLWGKLAPHAKADKSGAWNNGLNFTEHGYVRVRVGKDHPLADPNGYAYVHKLVMVAAIGRNLEPDELIHHRNGVKTDNRLENLELTTRAEPTRPHNLIRYHRFPQSA